jgi:hypothetical protein
MTDRVLFFTTQGCHLCEQAQAIIPSVLEYANQMRASTNLSRLQLQLVEISEEAALVQRYGSRIPVLLIEHTGQELGWPFDQTKLFGFLTGMQS